MRQPGAGLPNESRFSLGGRECVVRDGVCLLADGSALAGSASRMIDLVRTMVQKVNVPIHKAIKMATENPARALGLEKSKGCLRPDADADLVVISPDLEVVQTFSRGAQIYCHQGAAVSRPPNSMIRRSGERRFLRTWTAGVAYSERRKRAISSDALGRPSWRMLANHSRHKC